MICYDERQQLLMLDTDNTSYWISLSHGAPTQLYWGLRIDAQDAQYITHQDAHSSFDMELWRERQEYPVLDGRTFGSVCMKADIPVFLTLSGVKVNGDSAVCSLQDVHSGLSVALHYRLHSTQDVIERYAEVICGEKSVCFSCLESGACCLPEISGRWTAH